MKTKTVAIKMCVTVPEGKAEELKVLTHHIDYLIDEANQQSWDMLSIGGVEVEIPTESDYACDECGMYIENNEDAIIDGKLLCENCAERYEE